MWPLQKQESPTLLPAWSLSPCLWTSWPTEAQKNISERVTRDGPALDRAQELRGVGIIERPSEFQEGVVVSFFLFLQGFSVLETPKDAINKDSSPGPFDTFAFEGPGRESSLYVVRINSLYTQTINSSMDLPDPWKAQPCFPGPLGLYSIPYAHQCFGVLFCFLFVILKSPFLRIVRADQHCPQPSIYLHSPANVNQESKSQTEEALNGVIGGRSDFQLSVRGPGLLAGQGIVLSHKPAVCMGSQSRAGAARSGAAPARRRAWGWGILGGQTLWLWAG